MCYERVVPPSARPSQLAVAIDNLLSNRERAAALAANGRRLVEERYSPEAVGKALHGLYQQIIRKREKGEGRQTTRLQDKRDNRTGMRRESAGQTDEELD